jgi:nitrate reductase assembly molybdenum cofactor insertion protein NarJ
VAILEQAADALVKKLLEFKTETEQAAEELEELKEAVGEHDEGLEDDWSEFTEAVQSLLRVVNERGGALDPAGDQASAAVAQLGDLMTEVKESVEESLGASEELLTGLTDPAAGLEVETERLVAEAVEDPAEGVEGQLDAVLQGVQKTAAEGVESIREGFVKQAEDAVSGAELLVNATVKILTDSGTWVKQAVVAWTSKMTEVEDSVALEGFKKAEEHAPQVVEYAIDTLATAQQEAIADVEKLVAEARKALDELHEALDESNGTLGAAAEGLSTQTSDLTAAIGEASEALAGVTQVLVDHRAM